MNSYLNSVQTQFKQFEDLGTNALKRCSEEQLHFQYNPHSNSMVMLVKHVAGNIHSRFTDFLTSDGEKANRNRDLEFENETLSSKQLLSLWKESWEILYHAIDQAKVVDLESKIKIRGKNHTIIEAFNRQLAHYAYHIGQMVYLSKIFNQKNWDSLSIPIGQSEQFNQKAFEQNSKNP